MHIAHWRTRLRRHLRSIIAATLFVIAIWGFLTESNFTLRNDVPYNTLNEDWSQRIGDQLYPLPVAQDATLPTTGEPILLERTIRGYANDHSLLFYASHQEVQVYLEDKLIYELACPDSMASFHSPGRAWIEIPIRTEMAGQTLRIAFTAAFSQYNGLPDTFYFVPYNQIESVQIDYMWLRNMAAMVIFALAVISYINAGIWKNLRLRRYILCLADFYLFTALWLCGEINILSAWFGYATLSSIMSMIFIRIIPIAFCQMLVSILNRTPKWLTAMQVVIWLNLLLSGMAQLFFGISLVASLPITAGVYLFCSILFSGGMIHHLWQQRKKIDYFYKAGLTSTLLAIAALVEFYFYLTKQYPAYTGIIGSILCLAHAGIIHVLLVRNESHTDIIRHKLEEQRIVLERKPLFQQISAHFLFNTLNTISAYCKEQPEMADRAVSLLAQYMRRYMYLVDSENYVPFDEEISLIHLYLDILNLRYEDKIKLKLDIQYRNFKLPPLTLQPLVENAVLHGLHNYVHDGILRISTRRLNDMAELTVSDNGNGFVVEDSSLNGVGLRNLNRRISAMGGTLTVASQPGVGTEITLLIPPPPQTKPTERTVAYAHHLRR